jgi:hypothetical protein
VLCLIDCYLFQDALADVRWAIAGWNESTDGWADRHKKTKDGPIISEKALVKN